ncbi:hypothetical protein GCM10025883_20730 [Mobilicoccus caccae]|uniref:Uncharacterized protein n=1 Tax=Mobilicoccus caccae TaxID=1859295 RepID=A0ABQ6IQ37_9MICO|nr:hypothetical protein GCM10025883_20730 [Mobilicoccus caccae]
MRGGRATRDPAAVEPEISDAPSSVCTPRRAWHGEGLQPRLADRLGALLAHTVAALGELAEREPGLLQQGPRMTGQREFLLPLGDLATGVGRVVTGAAAVVLHQLDEIGLGHLHLGRDPRDLGMELGLDRLDLLGRPGLLTVTDRRGPGSGAGALRHRRAHTGHHSSDPRACTTTAARVVVQERIGLTGPRRRPDPPPQN